GSNHLAERGTDPQRRRPAGPRPVHPGPQAPPAGTLIGPTSPTEHELIRSYRLLLEETAMSRSFGRITLIAVVISSVISLPVFAGRGGGRGGGGMRGGGGGMRGGGGAMRGGGGGFSRSPSFSAPRPAGGAGGVRPAGGARPGPGVGGLPGGGPG